MALEIQKEHKKPVKNRPARRIWAILIVFAGLLFGIIYLFLSESRAYRPPEPGTPDQVNTYLTHYLIEQTYNNAQREAPFELAIDQFKLNEALSQFEWPQPVGEFMFSNPFVVFGQDRIYLMGTFEYRDVATVVTLEASPTLTADGQLALNIGSIRLGQLPATPIVLAVARQILDFYRTRPEAEQLDFATLDAILENRPFDAVITIFDTPLSIRKIAAKPGLLTVTLQSRQAPNAALSDRAKP